MFGNILGSLAKATVGVVTLPVAVVADVVTMGGVLTDKKQPYTASHTSGIVKNIENSINPDKE